MTTHETHHPDRPLGLETAENVRDLGGYKTRDGKITQWRRFVRAGDMDALSPSDQAKLVDYGITTVIDLRMQKEIEASPNAFTGSQAVDFRIHDFWGTRFDAYRSKNKTAPAHQKLADLYCAGLEQSGFVMAEIMATFAEDDRTGFAFHCRSGKDRTGLVAAMLLSIADVPEDTICRDFALTQEYLQKQAINPIDEGKPGAWQRGCEPETMEFTLNFIKQQFGDVPGYLQAQGVSPAALQVVRDKLLT